MKNNTRDNHHPTSRPKGVLTLLVITVPGQKPSESLYLYANEEKKKHMSINPKNTHTHNEKTRAIFSNPKRKKVYI